MNELIARVHALIKKDASGMYDMAGIPAALAADLPSEVEINGKTATLTADTMTVDGKTMPLTDKLRDSLRVQLAFMAVSKGRSTAA